MTQKVHCVLPGWCSVPLLLLLQLTAAQRATCPDQCIPLAQCPELLQLLKKPTPENLSALQRLTCSYEREPKICCPRNVAPQPTFLLPSKCGLGSDLSRVYGGTVAPIDSHPWMAVLEYSEAGVPELKVHCGGSIINERYILTAAHCVHPSALNKRKLEIIRLGDWDLSSDTDCEITRQGNKNCVPPAQDFTHEEVIIHPDYNTRVQFSDDIALIRLSKSIDLTAQKKRIRAVCLPPEGLNVSSLASQRDAWIAGWGFTENGTTSNRLLHVRLPFVNKEKCNITYNGNVVDEQMCVGGRKGQDSCAGDSGGPLVMAGPSGPPFLQIGVVSYGPVNCGQMDKPAVYTSVAHYRKWIEKNMRL
ncbi:CLIP domain-containing serine protease B4 [Procambarus clarkii]|uniref:CLIP domain-containing serine protease B4 n=1 Tax=Procambarus clarkii TaxID=6728 RepID=UPI001E6778AC|nr:CLIP domain-containing serine protease 14D-like [Procambarus clarkii]